MKKPIGPSSRGAFGLTAPIAIAAFVLPAVMFCAIAAACDIYPFGSVTSLYEDSLYQYVDFFTWLRRALTGSASLTYTAATGLGANAWGMLGYYLSSPLNLAVLVFPEDAMELCMFTITVVKVGLAGMAFAFYLRRRFGIGAHATIALVCAYACSSWVVTQSCNILWLDTLVVLPLAMWAGVCFARDGRWKLLSLCLAYSVVCCWYTAYMTMVFCAAYIIFELYISHAIISPLNWRYVVRRALGYARSCVLAVALGAFTFLPTVVAMLDSDEGLAERSMLEHVTGALAKLGVNVSEQVAAVAVCVAALVGVALLVALCSKRVPKALRVAIAVVLLVAAAVLVRASSQQCTIAEVMASFFAGTYKLWISPQLYCGIGVALAGVALLFSRRVDGRVRAASGIFLGTMVLCCLNPFMLLLTCLRMPGGFYCRVAFLALVVLLWMAAAYVASLDGEGGEGGENVAEIEGDGKGATRQLGVRGLLRKLGLGAGPLLAGAVVLLVVLCLSFTLRNGLSLETGLVNAVLVVVWAALGCAYIRFSNGASKKANSLQPAVGEQRQTAIKVSAHAFTAVLAVVLIVELVASGVGLRYITSAGNPTKAEVATYAADSQAQYRSLRSLDGGTYRFDKTYTRHNLAALCEPYGVGNMALSSYTSAHSGRALALLSALGYGDQDEFAVFCRGGVVLSDSLFGLKYLASGSQPAGYMDTGIAPTSEGAKVYRNERALSLGYGVSKAAASYSLAEERNPFEQQNSLVRALTGTDMSAYTPLTATQTTAADGTRSWTVEVPEGSWGYVYVAGELKNTDTAILTIDGATTSEASKFNHNVHALNTGISAATKHVVTISDAPGVDSSALQPLFYAIPDTTVSAILTTLGHDQAQFTSIGGDRVSATFTASSDDEYLLLTLPCDDGWTAKVNGQEVSIGALAEGACMLIPVEAGENQVELTYETPGLKVGCAISVVAVLAFVAGCVVGGRRRRRNA